MKKIRSLKLLILIPIILIALFAIINPTTHIAPVHSETAQAFEFKDLFDTNQDAGLSFKQYGGQLSELNTAGYDSSLTTSTDLKEFVIRIVNYALGFLGLIAVLVVIYGGVLYVTSGGDEDKTTTGRKAITYAVIGLIIVMGSFAFVNTIIAGTTSTQTSITATTTVTGGRTGTGFNSSAQEVRALAIDVYSGFANLAQTTQEFKNIQNDAGKSTLDPAKFPQKSEILNYLTSVKAKVSNLRSSLTEFSKAYVEVKSLEREIEAQIDQVKTFNQKSYVKLNSNGSVTYCDTDKSQSTTDVIFGVNPCEGMPQYYKGLYEFWGPVTEIRASWEAGNYLIPVLEMIKQDYLNILGNSFYRLQEIYTEFEAYDSLKDGATAYKQMKNAYGFEKVVVKNLAGDVNVEQSSGDNLYRKISEWKLGTIDEDPTADANYYLELGLAAQSKLFTELNNLIFVEARLSANVIEGSAPLTVIFDALATADPAGGSLQKENIIWDLGGEMTLAQLMSENDFTRLYPSTNVQCDLETLSPQEIIAKEQKVGATTQRCVFHKPGTYQAAIKIKSNEPGNYAPGISILTIKVNPPTTKIDLKMTPSGAETVTIMKYNTDDTLEVNKRNVSVTLDQASSGISFDASGTYAEQYKWEFGNGDVRDYTGSPTTTTFFDKAGKYEIVLEVLNKLSMVDRKIFTLEISDLSARINDKVGNHALINTPITFDASGSRSDSGGIRSYKWEVVPSAGQSVPEDLGIVVKDGKDLKKFVHEFKYPLSYDVRLTITDQNNNISTDIIEGFSVTSQKPIAQFTYEAPYSSAPSTLYFKGDLSFDPDGKQEYLDFTWNIEADENKYQFLDNTTAGSKNPVIKFLEKGDYKVTLKVEDFLTVTNNEESDEISKLISIDNILDLSWGKDEAVAALLDENGEAEVTFTLNSDNAVAYEIDFGDGEIENGSIDSYISITHKYTKKGKFEVLATAYNAEDEDNSIKKKIFIGDGDSPVAKINLYVNDVQIFDLTEPVQVSKKDIVKFDASDSKNVDGTGRKLLYSWNFGDTNRSSSKEANHTYKELSPVDPGYITAILTVTDKDDPSLNSQDEVKIDVRNLAPKFSSIQGIPRGERGDLTTPVTVLMKVFGATDPDGRITQYRWWYYNVNEPDNQLGVQITTSDTAQLVIGTNGTEGENITYAFGLEVMDSDNLKYNSEELYGMTLAPSVTVVNGPNELPTAKFNVSSTKVFAGDPVTFTSSSNDPDGQIVAYIWDIEGDGFYNNEPTDKSTIEYTYSEKNLLGYNVKLKIRDDKGGESISPAVRIYIDSNSQPPKAAFTTVEVPGGDGKVIQFKNNSTADEEAGTTIVKNYWDMDIAVDSDGDGFTDNDIDSEAKDPSHLYLEHGLYNVRLVVTDSQGATSEVIKEIVVGAITSVGEPKDVINPDPNADPNTDPVPNISPVKAVLSVIPAPRLDGNVYLPGEFGQVKFDFTKSLGVINFYVIDKNINFDTDGNGIPNDDWDFVTDKPGTWTTNYSKTYGNIQAQLTVMTDETNYNSVSQKIIFE